MSCQEIVLDTVNKKKIHSGSSSSADVAATRNSTGSQLSDVIKVYFDMAFIIGMCPFRLARRCKSSQYVIKTWQPQMLLCILVNACVLIVHLGNIRSGYYDLSESKKHPFNYFFYSTVLAKLILALITLWQMWFERTCFVNLVNFLASSDNSLPSISKKVIGILKGILLGNLIITTWGRIIIVGYFQYCHTMPYYLLSQYKLARYYFYFDTWQLGLVSRAGNYNDLSNNIDQGYGYIMLALLGIITRFCL